MAPEQWECGAIDHRTDQFSFCVALWEALCGERPYVGVDIDSIRRNVLEGALRAPPRSAAMPRWLRLTLERGLARKPQDRFPNMEALLFELRRERLAHAKRVAGWAAAALVLAGTATFLGYQRYLAATRCSREASATVTSLWGPSRRTAVETTLRGIGSDEALVRETLAQIDENISALGAARQAICEASRTSGPEAQASALRCLEQHTDQAAAALRFLSKPSPRLAQSVGLLLEELSVRRTCEALRAGHRPHAGDSAELRAAAAELHLLAALGRGASVVEQVPPLLERARAAGERAVAASLQLDFAEGLRIEEWRSHKAETTLREAIRDADAAGDDALSALARIRLFDHLVERMKRLDEAEELARDAEAWLERLGNPAGLRALYCQVRADLELHRERREAALAYSRQAVEWAERAYGARSTQAALARGNLGNLYWRRGEYSRAAAEIEAAAELAGSTRWRPPLRIAAMWTNAAYAHLYAGRPAQALAVLERAEELFRELGEEAASWQAWSQVAKAMALEDSGRGSEAALIYDRVLSNPELLDDASHAEALAGRARLRCARGEAKAALADAEEALRLAQTPGTEAAPLNEARFALARALGLVGQRERALALARDALAGFSGPEDGARRAEVERWLAAQTSSSGR
ncbi:MAG: protein kinase [Myxococcales bacterium]|jgi:tetratricopeptide (TPR) repeat protein